MFRALFRRPRTVRVPIDNHNVGVQKVKVSRPHSTALSRFVLMGAITTLTIQGMKYLDPLGNYQNRDLFQEQLDKVTRDNPLLEKNKPQSMAERLQNGKSLQSSSQSSSKLRFTVPIWIRKGQPRIYNAWEPEFKEFVKLQADEKRMDTLRRQVFDTVMQSIKRSPLSHHELKVIGFNGKVVGSLDIVPQLYPPPLYQVPCLLVDLDRPSAYFDWRELEPETGTRIERVFRPLVMLDAATAAAKVFLEMTYNITKAKLVEGVNMKGLKVSNGSRPQIALPQLPKDDPETKGSVSTNEGLIKSSKPIFPSLPDINDGKATRKMHQDVVSAMPYSRAIQQAAIAFNHVKTARQKAAVSTNVTGICQIRGYITFYGSRGKYMMEVIAHYLPSENVFVGAVHIKQKYIVQDFGALKKMMETQEQGRANAAAKKAFGHDKSKSPEKPSTTSKSASSPSSKDDREDKGK